MVHMLAFWTGDGFGPTPAFDVTDTPCQGVINNGVQLKVGLGTRGQTPLATRTAPKPMTPVSTGGLTLFPESQFQLQPQQWGSPMLYIRASATISQGRGSRGKLPWNSRV